MSRLIMRCLGLSRESVRFIWVYLKVLLILPCVLSCVKLIFMIVTQRQQYTPVPKKRLFGYGTCTQETIFPSSVVIPHLSKKSSYLDGRWGCVGL